MSFIKNYRRDKIIVSQIKLVVARGWVWGEGLDCEGAMRELLRVKEMFCSSIVVVLHNHVGQNPLQYKH